MIIIMISGNLDLVSYQDVKTYVTGQIWANSGKLQNVSQDNC